MHQKSNKNLTFFRRNFSPQRFFRQSKLTSFQRQLNLYGFRRITQGADAGAYYHEMFLRGRTGLCQRMARQKVKGTGHKQPADASSEPNFYQMTPLDMASSTSTVFQTSQSPPEAVLNANAFRPEESQITRPSHGFVLNERYETSPGMKSVHGAAHLLQGIASGRSFALPPASNKAQESASISLPQSPEDLIANSFIPDMTPRNQEEV